MGAAQMEDIIHKFDIFTQKPVKFLTVQSDVKEDIKNLVKSLYDYTKSQEKSDKKEKRSALPQLIVQDFDEEQIWQEIELQNSECWEKLDWEVANSITIKNDLVFPVETSDKQDDAVLEDNDENPSSDNENMSSKEVNSEEGELKMKKEKSKKMKSSIVDDKFFKLQEMEKFLLGQEKKENHITAADTDEESIDMFEDIDDEDLDEEDVRDMKYKDFFNQEDIDDNEQKEVEIGKKKKGEKTADMSEDNNNDFAAVTDDELSEVDIASDYDVSKLDKKNNNKKKVSFAMSESDDNSDDSDNSEVSLEKANSNSKDERKSEFELRQQRLKEKISKLEDKTLEEAPWQLKGEVDAKKRPQNSLLQEVLDFDLTTRPAPIITEQTTLTLEDIIKRRIKDKAWDDVIRKQKPVDDQLSFHKEGILDHSKSKQSLAQIYETEYLKQKQALLGEPEEEQEPEAHTGIRNEMTKLFAKLDALCHYHYTPKAPQAEVKIVSNTPAISMEEVAPVATSDAALLAPEEVKKKQKGELMSKDERTETDKKRERRKKKKMQQKKGTVLKVTDARNTKKAVEMSDQSLKSSKAFFQQLNDDSTSVLKKNKRNVKNKGQ